MATTVHSLLTPAEGYRSREAASFFAQMEGLSQKILDAIRGIAPEELEWQPAPGTNSIGMLLAHFGLVEVAWAQIAFLGMAEPDVAILETLGQEDDGMPLAPDAKPLASLGGKDLTYYEARLAKARAYYREASAKLTDEDMGREFSRPRPDGTERVVSVRFAMYHVLSLFAGHAGQIRLLRHLYRAMAASPSKAPGDSVGWQREA